VRIGLLQSKPPVTRLVLDLNTPQSYQIFPYGRTVIIRSAGGHNRLSSRLTIFRHAPRTGEYEFCSPPVQASKRCVSQADAHVSSTTDALDRAYKASLSEVSLQCTSTRARNGYLGGSGTEQVVADIGPPRRQEVLPAVERFSIQLPDLSSANDRA